MRTDPHDNPRDPGRTYAQAGTAGRADFAAFRDARDRFFKELADKSQIARLEAALHLDASEPADRR